MNKILEIVLRSLIAVILTIAALASAVITFPFLLYFEIKKIINKILKRIR